MYKYPASGVAGDDAQQNGHPRSQRPPVFDHLVGNNEATISPQNPRLELCIGAAYASELVLVRVVHQVSEDGEQRVQALRRREDVNIARK